LTAGNLMLFLDNSVLDSKTFHVLSRARIFKRVRNPGIVSKESISPAHLAWRAGTSHRVVVPVRLAGNRFLDSLKGLQILALLANLQNCVLFPVPTV